MKKLRTGVVSLVTVVANCNHWIGFHITNQLLEQGLKVEGIVDCKKDDSLSLFFGRNSNFSFYSGDTNEIYEQFICIGSIQEDVNISAELCVTLAHPSTVHPFTSLNGVIIELPLLFGEWMPMSENGMYFQGEFVPFSSDYFLQHAIYIHDFIDVFLKWLEMYEVGEEKQNVNKIKLDNYIDIKDNRPKEATVNQVIQHFRNQRLGKMF
ncbi:MULTISPECIES: hypothetical protein [Virgibacillus]|uniref:hypothetical protein n=1 Tax=Virgibacillus TaxID=84406 RepID=UPI0025E8D3CC|nr:hypothetical protein [Virgibacillus sp.]